MNELEQLRQRKLQEMQQMQEEQLQVQQQIAALENSIKPLLTKEALSRFGNLKTAHPELAIQVMIVLAQLKKAGKINEVDDILLKEILQEIQQTKRETKITRK
jgi:programmed cell death protein 5